MLGLFRRSKAGDYSDDRPGGLAGMLRTDSFISRVIIFLMMSAIFFLFLKVTERKIPTGLVPDSTEDTMHVVPHSK